MSEFFSHRVKAEAAEGITGRKKCDACLLGMLLFCREFTPESIVFQTENPVVRDLFIRLANHAAGEGAAEISELNRKSKNVPLYSIKIRDKAAIAALSDRAGVYFSEERCLSLAKPITEKQFGAFAAGVFLCCGSVVEPQKEYHLEFVTPAEGLGVDLCGLFSEIIGAKGKILRRGSSSVLYFKESETIEDILTLIGAPQASLELMNVKIYKDVRNRANRATNCDTGNCQRQNASARRQIEAIEKIMSSEGGFSRLPDELAELCRLRLENPELSLSELMELTNPPLSRSGVNHRFARIIKIAEEL